MPKSKHTNYLKPLMEALDPISLEIMGRVSGFMRRERKITPESLIPSLVASMGSEKIDTITGLWYRFREDSGHTVAYKSFHDKLAQDGFAEMMKSLAMSLMKRLLIKGLCVSPSSPFRSFKDILFQDGTAFGVNPKLAGAFPGIGSAAGVEIHTTMSLFTGGLNQATLTGHSASERDFLPKPSEIKDCLLMADRGYFSFAYSAMIDENGGFYLFRAPVDLSSLVLGHFKEGCFIPNQERPPLSRFVAENGDPVLDLLIRPAKGWHTPFRMVVLKTPKGRTFLMTNLPAAEFPPELVGWAYRLRWQIELLYKEWKSHANLHCFTTANKEIAEGLIWASISAAIVKRFVAFTAQAIKKFPVSTLKAAVLLKKFLTPLLVNLIRDPEAAYIALDDALNTLRSIGHRSNLKRERQKGRLRIGLQTAFET